MDLDLDMPSFNAFDALRPQKKSRKENISSPISMSPVSEVLIEDESEQQVESYSTFKPSDSNFVSNGDFCLISMQAGESLCFQGTALVGCIQGECSVMNYRMKARNDKHVELHPCYSSSSSSLLKIESRGFNGDKNKRVAEKKSKKSLSAIQKLLAELLAKSTDINSAIVVIKRFTHSGINDIQSMLPSSSNIFKFMHSDGVDIFNIPGFFPVLGIHPSASPLRFDASWTTTINLLTAHPSPIVLVTGAKNTGKSTFSKSLVNALLSKHDRVAYLETDLGQCEFTPTGFTSLTLVTLPLLGPSFTHLTTPHRQVYLGTTTPLKDPEIYLSSITSLLETYRKEFKGVPLIVNTHGWIKSLGFDLVVGIARECKGTHLVCLEAEGREGFKEALDEHMDGGYTEPFSCRGMSDSISKISGADQRTLATLAFFSQRVNETTQSVTWQVDGDMQGGSEAYWDFRGITERVPFCVPLSKVQVCFPYDDVPSDEILYALNCTTVGLLTVDSSAKTDNSFPVPDMIKQSYLGLVRGVYKDASGESIIQILTCPNLNIEDLSCVNVIVRGSSVELPTSLMLKGLENRHNIPYTCSSGSVEGIGALAKRPRKNMARKRLQ